VKAQFRIRQANGIERYHVHNGIAAEIGPVLNADV
jgi:hypothetical protein